MENTIEIQVPEKFNFDKTIRLIQRGSDDPINQIHDKEFARSYWINNQLVVLGVKHNLNCIKVSILYGCISKKDILPVINSTFGLDDPLLQNQSYNIPYKEKLENHFGIPAIGYTCYFEALVQIILGQQISVIVANKIRSKFTTRFGDVIKHKDKIYYAFPQPNKLINQSIANLRMLGMSESKSKSIILLAKEFAHKNLSTDIQTANSIDSVRNRLIQIYGIGDWTIDWFLLRALRRFEIIPSSDIAVRKAFTWWANKKILMTSATVNNYAKKLNPFGGSLTYRILTAYQATFNRINNLD